MKAAVENVVVTVDMLLVTSDRKILLIQRRDGTWALPGGKLDEGERIEHAAYRELREETHVEGVELHYAGYFDEPGRDPRGRYISHAFIGYVSDEAMVKVQADDDANDVAWWSLGALPVLAFDHDEIVQRTVGLQSAVA